MVFSFCCHLYLKIMKKVGADQNDNEAMQRLKRQVNLHSMVNEEEENHLRQFLKSLSVDGMLLALFSVCLFL